MLGVRSWQVAAVTRTQGLPAWSRRTSLGNSGGRVRQSGSASASDWLLDRLTGPIRPWRAGSCARLR